MPLGAQFAIDRHQIIADVMRIETAGELIDARAFGYAAEIKLERGVLPHSGIAPVQLQ
jgi:hypothetical protein